MTMTTQKLYFRPLDGLLKNNDELVQYKDVIAIAQHPVRELFYIARKGYQTNNAAANAFMTIPCKDGWSDVSYHMEWESISWDIYESLCNHAKSDAEEPLSISAKNYQKTTLDDKLAA